MQLSFRTKLVLPLVLSWLCLLAVMAQTIHQQRSLRMSERQAQLVAVTDMAMSIAKEYDGLATAGKLPLDEAKTQALARIQALRYGSSGYFTMLDARRVLMHPFKPELVGTDVAAFKDPDGAQVYVDALKVAAAGGGFTSYLWAKPGEKQPVSKIAYDAAYKPWAWTSMTGLYVDDLDALFRRDLLRGLALLAVIGLALTAVVLLIIRSVERSVGGEPAHAADTAMQIANGNLAVDVPLAAGDDRSLMFAIGTMRDRLAEMVGNVRSSTDSIALASSEIASGNNDLSSRTEEQASALQQTAASMKQLAETVRQNAENAEQGNGLAMSASSVAARGGDVVGQVVETMKGINESSRRIADIISVIDGIAFQTNILALNAAVEAARAGEQGRGFAVVAAEVRTLAQRSADAAKEIKSLITTSVERVEQGTQLVDQAGATMDEVVQSIRRVTDLMGEISAASREQSQGVAQIGDAVNQMDQVTQQNAALVEQSAAAADSLKAQAQQLVGAVAVFRTGGHEASNSPMPQPAHPSPRAMQVASKTRAATTSVPLARTGTDDWQAF
ncbi:methyl-accepting chemotaxis protein [Ramlibacter sp. MMS24-I3-19]|uniref:methyl-accepting chemotaxis protein n=1 Tax=Ramlibacter sp. MMS24-I3-19 TaxID=3416606 RepID=UPI003CFE6D3B